MKKVITVLLVMQLFISLSAAERKKVVRTFKVEPGQKIEIINIPGMDVVVRSWDEDRIKFDLDVRIKSSDNEYEKEYVENFDIIESRNSSELIIKFNEAEGGDWSFWDIFKLKFHFYVDKTIRGEIFLPKTNPLYAEFRYSRIDLADMQGEIVLNGRSNDLKLSHCDNVREIKNSYGDARINKCKGDLLLESRSSEISVKDFDGNVNIDAPYSNVEVYDVNKSLDISTRSAEVKVNSIGGGLILDVPYCDVEVKNVKGNITVSDRSGNISIETVSGFEIDAPYSGIRLIDANSSSNQPLRINSRSENIYLEKITGNLIINDNYSTFEMNQLSGNIQLSSRSGDISVKKIKGNWESKTEYSKIEIDQMDSKLIKIENRSEPVKLDLISIPQEIFIKNSYGSVSIMIPEGFNGSVDLSAQYGEIDCDLPLKFKSEGNSAIAYGNIGNGSGKIIIETRSGDISIKQK